MVKKSSQKDKQPHIKTRKKKTLKRKSSRKNLKRTKKRNQTHHEGGMNFFNIFRKKSPVGFRSSSSADTEKKNTINYSEILGSFNENSHKGELMKLLIGLKESSIQDNEKDSPSPIQMSLSQYWDYFTRVFGLNNDDWLPSVRKGNIIGNPFMKSRLRHLCGHPWYVCYLNDDCNSCSFKTSGECTNYQEVYNKSLRQIGYTFQTYFNTSSNKDFKKDKDEDYDKSIFFEFLNKTTGNPEQDTTAGFRTIFTWAQAQKTLGSGTSIYDLESKIWGRQLDNTIFIRNKYLPTNLAFVDLSKRKPDPDRIRKQTKALLESTKEGPTSPDLFVQRFKKMTFLLIYLYIWFKTIKGPYYTKLLKREKGKIENQKKKKGTVSSDQIIDEGENDDPFGPIINQLVKTLNVYPFSEICTPCEDDKNKGSNPKIRIFRICYSINGKVGKPRNGLWIMLPFRYSESKGVKNGNLFFLSEGLSNKGATYEFLDTLYYCKHETALEQIFPKFKILNANSISDDDVLGNFGITFTPHRCPKADTSTILSCNLMAFTSELIGTQSSVGFNLPKSVKPYESIIYDMYRELNSEVFKDFEESKEWTKIIKVMKTQKDEEKENAKGKVLDILQTLDDLQNNLGQRIGKEKNEKSFGEEKEKIQKFLPVELIISINKIKQLVKETYNKDENKFTVKKDNLGTIGDKLWNLLGWTGDDEKMVQLDSNLDHHAFFACLGTTTSEVLVILRNLDYLFKKVDSFIQYMKDSKFQLKLQNLRKFYDILNYLHNLFLETTEVTYKVKIGDVEFESFKNLLTELKILSDFKELEDDDFKRFEEVKNLLPSTKIESINQNTKDIFGKHHHNNYLFEVGLACRNNGQYEASTLQSSFSKCCSKLLLCANDTKVYFLIDDKDPVEIKNIYEKEQVDDEKEKGVWNNYETLKESIGKLRIGDEHGRTKDIYDVDFFIFIKSLVQDKPRDLYINKIGMT